jgi:ATP-dependent exoDNAse (exonuclease V) beta subunit
VVITDLNAAAVEFMRSNELDLADLLYVGMTRAKYQCVVLESARHVNSGQFPSKAG